MLITKPDALLASLATVRGEDLFRSTMQTLRAYKLDDTEPSWKGDYIDRAMRVFPKITNPLLYYSSVDFEKYLLDEHTHEIVDLETKLAQTVVDLDAAVRKALHSRDILAVIDVENKLRAVENLATKLVTLLSIETEERSRSILSSYTPKSSNYAKDMDIQAAKAAALMAKGAMVRIVTGAISGRRLLSRLVSRETGASRHDEKSDAARMRRLRVRRRQGVVYRPTINLYAGELDLLRLFGFLTAADKSDKAAIDAALEAFLLAAFKTYPHEISWTDRHRLLLDRAKAEREDDEPDASE